MQHKITGVVRTKVETSFVPVKVVVYRSSFRKLSLLAEATTNSKGEFQLIWDYLTKLEPEDLHLKVFSENSKTELHSSPMGNLGLRSLDQSFSITLSKEIPRTESEFEYIQKAVAPHIDGVTSFENLRENESHQDISFLGKKTSIETEKLTHLALSHKLSRDLGTSPAVFYGILSKNVLQKSVPSSLQSLHSSIGTETKTQPLIYEMALLDSTEAANELKKAVDEKLIPSTALNEWAELAKGLEKFVVPAKDYFQNEKKESSASMFGRILQEGIKISPKSHQTKDEKSEADASLKLGELIGHNDEVFKAVLDHRGISKEEDLKKMLSYSQKDWIMSLQELQEVKKVSFSPDLNQQYATTLGKRLQKEFPTEAFKVELRRNIKTSPFKHHQEISDFLENTAGFDLKNTNIDAFRLKNELGKNLSEGASNELKSVQRVFKLIPDYQKSSALLKANLHSAQSIVSLGKTRFTQEIAPKAGLSSQEAISVYNRAENVHAATLTIVGELQDTFSTSSIPALKPEGSAANLKRIREDFPNLKTLFHSTDVCACKHCRSVYSPAAYLVELLQYLDNRSVIDLTNKKPGKAKDVLFSRRKDIGEIDLSCANANVPVPYIDLVCELLEDIVAPDHGKIYTGPLADGTTIVGSHISAQLLAFLQQEGIPVTAEAKLFGTETPEEPDSPYYLRDEKAVCKISPKGTDWLVRRLRQTLSSAEELAAAPEYVNAKAWDIMKSSSYAFQLPFDLQHTEAQAYLNRFGLKRASLMQDFSRENKPPSAEDIAAEKLGLTYAELKIITTPAPANQSAFWNIGTQPALKLKNVNIFLARTQLSYQELEQLLSLKFIDPDAKLTIQHLDLSCDTAQKEISNLTDAALDRIHRFLRLQKKTGWDFEVLDEIVSLGRLGNGTLDENCLIVMANLREIQERTGIRLNGLVCFYGAFPADLNKYNAVFQNKSSNVSVDEALTYEAVQENQDASGGDLLTDHLNSLASSLKLGETELDALVASLNNKVLSHANLSELYAMSAFIHAFGLKAEDYLLLSELKNAAVFQSPNDTLEFVGAIEEMNSFPVDLKDLHYFLAHEATDLALRELDDSNIVEILSALQASYQEAWQANLSPYNEGLTADELKEPLRDLTFNLGALSEEDVEVLVGFSAREWDSLNAATDWINQNLGGILDVSRIISALVALDGSTAGQNENLRKDLIKVLMQDISTHLFESQQKAGLSEGLTNFFKTEEDIVNTFLRHAKLNQNKILQDILVTSDLIDRSNPVPVPPQINAAAFPEQFKSLRLLHKLISFSKGHELELNELEWLLNRSDQFGWVSMDKLPYATGQSPVAYAEYAVLWQIISLFRRLTPVQDPSNPERNISFFTVLESISAANITAESWFNSLSLLTAYPSQMLEDIDRFFSFSAGNDFTKYHSPQTWELLEKCAEKLRTLGAEVSQVEKFIAPVLTEDETRALRVLLKTRYDEATWLITLKEISNSIRVQKRDALVAYILADNPSIKDENDLFDILLVDVEMEACMPSSRIVQAHGSIQLFVQRCLMGLEPMAAAEINNDIGWEQWKWMKNYRVWEANRKVFLYPENWLEVELKNDKSYIFKEFENELLQNELSRDSAEQAVANYLEKLDDISFLEIVATYYQEDIYTMHVFGRTKGGNPPAYYYRTFVKERYWTPWEKVELDITGDQLLAFVRNNRLTLAWIVFGNEPSQEQKIRIPDETQFGTEISLGKPQSQLTLQLALSEYANNKWKPKKVSEDLIKTDRNDNNPSFRKYYNLKYYSYRDQMRIFRFPQNDLVGIFDIAGCKGYPEKVHKLPETNDTFYPLPEFRDTHLWSQRLREDTERGTPDDLAVRSLIHPVGYLPLLTKTNRFFRLTYPFQKTLFDTIIGETIAIAQSGSDSIPEPFGTFLPYFMEDSLHNYVIVPGFYSAKTGHTKRTASDTLKILRDSLELMSEFYKGLSSAPDPQAYINQFMQSDEYQNLVNEAQVYSSLDYREQFINMYHPLVCPLRKKFYRGGINELMKRETQLTETSFDFGDYYRPSAMIQQPYPAENVDFQHQGGYSIYNWEMFFYAPLMIATRFTQNQQFEEALSWFHYIFNPTGALEGPSPQKYWVTKPFFQTLDSEYVAQRINSLLFATAATWDRNMEQLVLPIEEWREKPFDPHVIARFRPVAYQKTVLMKYIDNLVAWGDHLFRQDTMESIAQATQMYILADKLLGPKPKNIPPVASPEYMTYNQIEARLGAFGNALIDIENVLPADFEIPSQQDDTNPVESEARNSKPSIPTFPTLATLYFCIPQNEKLLEYWNVIADRLFKLRNCQNIDGVERSLALFAPPIDPAMLVKANAAGLDLASVLTGMSANLPHYRFNVLAQKASELSHEVKSLGNALLTALEKKDGESLSLLRSEHERNVLRNIRGVKELQIEEAKEQIEILGKTQKVTQERLKHYRDIKKIISKEQLNLDKLGDSHSLQKASLESQQLAAIFAMIPDTIAGVSGFGGSPHAVFSFGGTLMSKAAEFEANRQSIKGNTAAYEANRASITANYDRRWNDWKFQERLAKKELDMIARQMTAAEIRLELAEKDLQNHEQQIENAKKADEFMLAKYTNKELYNWLIGQLSNLYFRSYQLAFDTAKKAERAYRFELGNEDSFIGYGYWDSMKKGLQSAEPLIHDIKRMETAYLDKNKREYEITKHISLSMLDPMALIKLRNTGVCDFEVPEALFDMDHAGHYFRRIKSVSISLPGIVGPYTSVSAKLSLVSNKYRKVTALSNTANTGYPEDWANDERFIYNVGSIQSIATSHGQNDSGVFELNFRDERYLPFEGAGAVSHWRLELPSEVRQFDYSTISEAVIHMKYTSREGGSGLRNSANSHLKNSLHLISQQLGNEGLHLSFNLKHDLPNHWHLLKQNGQVELMIDKTRLPFMAQSLDPAIENVLFVMKVKDNPTTFACNVDGEAVNLSPIDEIQRLIGSSDIDLDVPFTLEVAANDLQNVEEILMVVKYSF